MSTILHTTRTVYKYTSIYRRAYPCINTADLTHVIPTLETFMQELLEHKWVRSPEAKLRARELEGTKEKIKEFNAKRKLKAGGNTCSRNSVLVSTV